MKTLIFASNPSLHFSKHSPFKPKLPIFHPKTSKKFNYQLTTLKPQASAKGFSNTRKPSSTNKKINDVTIMKNPNKKNNDEEDELPKVVMYRIIGRILFSVLVPMALGLSFLHLYGELKEREIWNGPLWVPFMTTLITFGASSLGIAYGVLSSSLDAEREGTLLGFQEIEKNWVEMWQQEDLLDWALGKEHSVILRRSELKTFVDLHADQAGKGGELSHHETSIITGAMDLTQKTAIDAMTHISETFSLDINSKLDMHTMTQIMSKGHSRVPIHSGNPRNIIGLILVKNLIFCRPEDETPIKNLIIRKIPRVYESWPLYEILNQFKKGHSHMAVVLKGKMETESNEAHAVDSPIFLNIITNKESNQAQINIGESNSSYVLEMSQRSSIPESSDVEFHSPTLENMMVLDNDVGQESKQWDQEIGCMTHEQIMSLNSGVMHDEAIGIITMEDLMEELLQGDILDETDEYVHLQKNIRINLQQSHRSQSRSSRRTFGSSRR